MDGLKVELAALGLATALGGLTLGLGGALAAAFVTTLLIVNLPRPSIEGPHQ